MLQMFRRKAGDWVRYRQLPQMIERDFHRQPDERVPHDVVMSEVVATVRDVLSTAQEDGLRFAMFVHGRSTSRLGRETIRSVIRRFMRSPEATPFIRRSDCIQHETVFVAAIRPKRPLSSDCAAGSSALAE
jgi:hypothetical protein